jgi:pyruvate dehydrogenase E1 component alpha subunit
VAKKEEYKITESAAELEEHLRDMLFIRHFEEKCNRVYREGKAGGYMHVYIGMEALAVGWMKAIRKGEDYVITAYSLVKESSLCFKQFASRQIRFLYSLG